MDEMPDDGIKQPLCSVWAKMIRYNFLLKIYRSYELFRDYSNYFDTEGDTTVWKVFISIASYIESKNINMLELMIFDLWFAGNAKFVTHPLQHTAFPSMVKTALFCE